MTLFRTRKPMPFVFMMVSLLYFIYVISLGSSTMIGDEIGGDPGGRLLPLALSIFMFIASTVLFLTDRKGEAAKDERLGSSERRLFLLTVIVAILYVVAMRPVGFLLTTATLVFTLTFYYLQGNVERKSLKPWVVGILATLAFLVALYSIGRTITRFLLLNARQGRIPQWLGTTGFVVGIVLVVVLAIYLIVLKLTRARFHAEQVSPAIRNAFDACMLSVVTTELIYLVFRQMFLVELVRGLITW
ncbi:MAG: tripartite tricarboxylate transporter TctB family protein [Sphaerochaetaceae bacterium]|jgi:hypothetical protein|nr:tripartite tricarboxylate transporter TctB family protein [Sphaerochaetaceae bacterium]